MIGHINEIIKALTMKPKTVFLIDSSGAVLTSIFLIAVLKTFNEFFGMPQETLTLLSIVALVLAIYSFSCFAFLDQNMQNYLRAIIAANLTYCILTLGLVIYYHNKLTILGIAYFFGEILMICGLVYIELMTLKAISQNIPQ